MYKKIKFSSVGQGVLRAAILTMVCILIYSVILTSFSLSANVTSVFITVLTLASVMYGAIYASLKNGDRGWLIGIMVALIYMVILYIVYILCGNGLALGAGDLLRLLLALIVGTLSGMLAVNL